MTILTAIPDDAINIVFESLHIVVLLKVLMTCKQFYAMQKTAIRQNATASAYTKYDPTASFIPTYCNSDVDYDENLHPIVRCIISASRVHMYNTYKLFAFNNVFHNCDKTLVQQNRYSLSCYYVRQIANKYPREYSSDLNVRVSKKLFDDFMNIYNWNYTNIDIFDIYQIIFCVRSKNNKNLAEILRTMHIYAPQDVNTFTEICKSLMSFVECIPMCGSYNKKIKACMICVIYKFMSYVPLEFLGTKLHTVVLMQCDTLGEQIERMRYAPKYLKKALREPLYIVKDRLTIK